MTKPPAGTASRGRQPLTATQRVAHGAEAKRHHHPGRRLGSAGGAGAGHGHVAVKVLGLRGYRVEVPRNDRPTRLGEVELEGRSDKCAVKDTGARLEEQSEIGLAGYLFDMRPGRWKRVRAPKEGDDIGLGFSERDGGIGRRPKTSANVGEPIIRGLRQVNRDKGV
jgi:hypothetical protein